MARELDARELDELLGAYALDAVDLDESTQVARYIERNPRARAEVEQFRETAAMLAFAGADAPPGLWDRITQSMDEEPPRLALPIAPAGDGSDATVTSLSDRRRGRAARRVLSSLAAAAAAVLIVVLGLQVIDQGEQLDDLRSAMERDGVRQAAEIARTNPDARVVTLRSDDGEHAANVVYLPDGTGYLEENNLPALPADRTYQLWALVGDPQDPTVISAGVLGSEPGATAFRFPGPVVGFVVTEEAAPGVVSSQNPALLAGTF